MGYIVEKYICSNYVEGICLKVVGTLTGNLTKTIKDSVAGSVGTVISIVLVVGLVGYGYSVQNWLIVGICVGAIGGLVHEIAQSHGKYMIPTTDESGNFMLGGLMGLIDGGIAGLLVMQGQNSPPTNPQFFFISVFFAGLALKGVNDAINPSKTGDGKGAAG